MGLILKISGSQNFVIVNIATTANFTTPQIHPTISITGIPSGDVVLSSGSVDANIDGRIYGFDDINYAKETQKLVMPMLKDKEKNANQTVRDFLTKCSSFFS